MQRRILLGSGATMFLAGCTGIGSDETILDSEVTAEENTRVVEFLDAGENIANVDLRWPEVHPLHEASVDHFHISPTNASGLEWIALTLTIAFDEEFEPPFLYLQVDGTVPRSTIDRGRDGTTTVHIDERAARYDGLDFAVVRRDDTEKKMTMNVNIQVEVADKGIFSTTYSGEESISTTLPTR